MKFRISLGLLAVSVLLSGCDWWKRAPDPQYDSRAKDVLLETLETWKQGQTRTLARRTPPIRFVDDDHIAGFKLVEYRLVEPDQPILPFQNVPVTIKVRDGGGQVIERTTVYQVTLDPQLAVLRAE